MVCILFLASLFSKSKPFNNSAKAAVTTVNEQVDWGDDPIIP